MSTDGLVCTLPTWLLIRVDRGEMTDSPSTRRTMNKTLLHYLGAALIGASSFVGVAAHAALTLTGVSCNGQGTGMTSQPGYLSCSGSWSGNNLNQSGDVASQVLIDWGLTGLAAQDVTGSNSQSSAGTLTFANQSGLFVLSLKAGDAFSLYEFNAANVAGGISSIHFDTLGVGFFSGGANRIMHDGQGLSHADLYSTQAPVPEPEIYALMLAGLGVVGFIARRRHA